MALLPGTVDKELLNELKNQAEYHFNTMGRDLHIAEIRSCGKQNLPCVSRLFASASSPEIEFEQVDGSTKIAVSREEEALKTHNKLYLHRCISWLREVSFCWLLLFLAIPGNNDIAPTLTGISFDQITFFPILCPICE
ncbi:MAG: hypothetical protein U5K71_01625 [Gracilimonas sp.]|nr:hypothetical protein [Gracilimonas sp.]